MTNNDMHEAILKTRLPEDIAGAREIISHLTELVDQACTEAKQPHLRIEVRITEMKP